MMSKLLMVLVAVSGLALTVQVPAADQPGPGSETHEKGGSEESRERQRPRPDPKGATPLVGFVKGKSINGVRGPSQTTVPGSSIEVLHFNSKK